MTLWQATRDLHHACEQHPIGASMAAGSPPAVWYANWLQVLLQLHTVVDPHLDPIVHRTTRVLRDLNALGIPTKTIKAAEHYTNTLTNTINITGAGYVLTGAHLMGGEIMRRRLQGYPTEHLCWQDRKQALKCLDVLRASEGVAEPARLCFQALLDSMDEIYENYPQ